MPNKRTCSTEFRIDVRIAHRARTASTNCSSVNSPWTNFPRGAAHQQAARGLPDEGLPQLGRRPCAGEGLQRQFMLWVLPQQSLFLDPSYSRFTLARCLWMLC